LVLSQPVIDAELAAAVARLPATDDVRVVLCVMRVEADTD
jgi:hypothetical protein